jgi:hypothetical protein
MRIALREAVVTAVTLLGPVLAPTGPASGREARAGVLERRAGELLAGLASKRLGHVKFENADLETVLTQLRASTGWNFVLKRHVLLKAGIDVDTIRSNLDLDDVSVGVVLLLVLEPQGLVAKVEDNVVFVTTKADALGPPVFSLYDVRHLTWQKTDFRGSDLDLRPSGYVESEDHPLYGGEAPVTDDPFLDPQHIVDLVKEMVDGTWDAEGWSITATKTFLAVKAPRSVQRRVATALTRMAELK